MAKTGIFFKKVLGTFFSRLQALTNCKVSEKQDDVLEDISGHTYARTYGRDSLGLQQLRRETKKLGNYNEWIAKNMRKTSIFGNFGPKGPILDSYWPKWAKPNFSKKRLEHFCRAYKP